MTPYRVLDLFSGIGGFSLGLERTGGFKTVAFCEIEPFCRRVLAKHWPEVPCYDDVRTLTADRLRADGIAVDVICGGFPCQDISNAGNGEGLDGTRSGLWSEIARLAGELRPAFIIVENVSNLLSGPSKRPGAWFGRVLGDLAALGYDAEWHCIPASAVGAPHPRDRVWVVSNPVRGRAHAEQILRRAFAGTADAAGNGSQGPLADADRERELQSQGSICDLGRRLGDGCQASADACRPHVEGQRPVSIGASSQFRDAGDGGWWASEPDVGRMAHGVPARVDRLRSLGNAVVPQIPELIGRAILSSEGRLAA